MPFRAVHIRKLLSARSADSVAASVRRQVPRIADVHWHILQIDRKQLLASSFARNRLRRLSPSKSNVCATGRLNFVRHARAACSILLTSRYWITGVPRSTACSSHGIPLEKENSSACALHIKKPIAGLLLRRDKKCPSLGLQL